MFSDLSAVDVASGRVRRLTRGARAYDPDVSPDGRTVVEIAADHGQCHEGLAIAHTDSDGVEAGHIATDCHDGGCAGCPCEDTTLAVKPAPVERKSWDFLSLPPTKVLPWVATGTATLPLGRDLPVANLVTMRSLRSVVLLV